MIFPDQPWFLLSHLSQGATYPNISVPSSLAFLLAGPREAQLGMDGKAILNTYISTHTPLRAQPALRRLHPEVQNFYSHASCEARPGDCSVTVPPDQFLLTRLLRGATISGKRYNLIKRISTHTPLARRDRLFHDLLLQFLTFYSHASCEARHQRWNRVLVVGEFLLTRPMRGATALVLPWRSFCLISTHTPHAGRDYAAAIAWSHSRISTHTPHAGRDETQA